MNTNAPTAIAAYRHTVHNYTCVLGLQWCKIELYVALCPHHNLWHHLDDVIFDQREAEAVHNGGHHHLLFVCGKVLPNAVAVTSREWHVGKRIPTLTVAWVKAKWIEIRRIRPSI